MSFSSRGTDPTRVPSEQLQERSIASVTFLPKVHNLNLITREQIAQTENFLQNNWLLNFKCQGHDSQIKWRRLFQEKGDCKH